MKHSTRLSYLMVLSWETKFGQAKNTINMSCPNSKKEKKHPQQSLTSCMGYYAQRRYNRLLSGEATQQPNHPDKNTNQ